MKVGTFITEKNTLGVTCVFEPRDLQKAKYLFRIVSLRLPAYRPHINRICTDIEIAESEDQHLIISMEDTAPFDAFFEELEMQFRKEGRDSLADKTKEQYLSQKTRIRYHGTA